MAGGELVGAPVNCPGANRGNDLRFGQTCRMSAGSSGPRPKAGPMIQLGKPRRRYSGYIRRAQCAKHPAPLARARREHQHRHEGVAGWALQQLALHRLARGPRWRRRPRAR